VRGCCVATSIAILGLFGLGLCGLTGLFLVVSPVLSSAQSAVAVHVATSGTVTSGADRLLSSAAAGVVSFASMSDIERNGEGLRSGQPFRLTVSQTELTERINMFMILESQMPIQGVAVKLGNGQIMLSGNVAVLGFPLETVVAVVEPVIQDGHASLTIKDIDTGRIPFPSIVRNSVLDAFNSSIGSQYLDVSVVVDSVSIDQGMMVIDGRAR
jgi:uncharacterized protein YpmS